MVKRLGGFSDNRDLIHNVNIKYNTDYTMSTDTIKVGKYSFTIKDNCIFNTEGKIYGRNFQIGGNYADCVNVSILYDREGNPISAKIPTLVYDEECSLGAPLDRGEGTVILIKTLLRYIKNKIPTINEFVFEDKSNIECGTDDEKYQKRRRKRGTYAVPIVLYYFSIAFNGETWYEKHFNAYQKDVLTHSAYKIRIMEMLHNIAIKMQFNDFLLLSQPQRRNVEELKILYEKAQTYGTFFNSIAKKDRCRLVRDWLPTFMDHYLKGVFKNTDWVIDVRKMDVRINADKQGGRVTRKNRPMYYCPKGRIRLAIEQKDMGA